MYDQWVEEVESGMMVGVMMIDLSAAFDMVDHELLLQKLELFGMDARALRWVQSYLTTSQSVWVDVSLLSNWQGATRINPWTTALHPLSQ